MRKQKTRIKTTKVTSRAVTSDHFFKYTFSILGLARDFLTTFLPSNVVQHIDFDQLILDDTTQVSKQYRRFVADVLYRAKLKESDKSIAIAFLFEHKTEVPENIFIQLLNYLVGIWEHDIKNKNLLTFVIPIVVYNGKKEWKQQRLADYFPGLPEFLLRYLPEFDYNLTDYQQMPIEVITRLKQDHFLQKVSEALKFASETELGEWHFSMITEIPDTVYSKSVEQELMAAILRFFT
jgi:predicted transposase/invertase (TIGR01784 family)